MIENKLLPKLTKQQNDCLLAYFTTCMGNKVQAYRSSYDCTSSNANTVYREATRFFQNPTITPWLDYYSNTIKEYQEQEIKYSRKDFFEELERIQSKTEDTKNVSVALKAIELKGKAMGLLKDNAENNQSVVVNMGEIKVDGKELKLDIGNDSTS